MGSLAISGHSVAENGKGEGAKKTHGTTIPNRAQRAMRISVGSGLLGVKMRPATKHGTIGIVVTGFSPVDGKAGPVESQGVRVGMWLIQIDDDDVDSASFKEVMAIFKSKKSKPKMLTFCPPEMHRTYRAVTCIQSQVRQQQVCRLTALHA